LRIELERSEPIPSADTPLAIATASPPDDPPADRSGACGLRVAPKRSFAVS
jgi:hypothetical protein